MRNLLFLSATIILLNACSSSYQFFQVYKVNPEQKSETPQGLVFEDENCIITYNLWSNGGNAGFDVYNKTKSTIEIDLNNSFFVLNGFAKQYYQNRTYVEAVSTGIQRTSSVSYNGAKSGSGVSQTNSSGIERQELSIIKIPAGISVSLEGFNIVNAKWKDCMMGNPFKMKDVVTKSFNRAESPFRFGNILTYIANGKKFEIIHSFYVSAITNYPSRGYLVRTTRNDCGVLLKAPEYRFPKTDPDQFYWSYIIRR